LNRMLSRNGHPRMHQTTIVSLLTEACEMVFDEGGMENDDVFLSYINAGDNRQTTGSMLEALLEVVASNLGKTGDSADSWVAAVLWKLKDINVVKVQDFIRMVLNLNRVLSQNGHQRMHESTLNAMLSEACEMFFEPSGMEVSAPVA